MDLARTCSSFQSDLDFCPDCGSVLPLPGTQDTVPCARCGFSINVRGEGLLGSGPARGPSEEGSEAWGPPDRFDCSGTLKQEIKPLHFPSRVKTCREGCGVTWPNREGVAHFRSLHVFV